MRRTIENCMEILEIFRENRLEFIEKMEDHQDLMNDFDWAGKIKHPACKILRAWSKSEDNFENFQEILRYFDQNLYGKWTFSQFLLHISWIFDSAPKVYTSGR